MWCITRTAVLDQSVLGVGDLLHLEVGQIWISVHEDGDLQKLVLMVVL